MSNQVSWGKDKPHLLVISHVFPFPRTSGQQQRVFYKLRAFRSSFKITFLTFTASREASEVREQLLPWCDNVILLSSKYSNNGLQKIWHRAAGTLFTLRTGLKLSNYIIGQLELTPLRVAAVTDSLHFDCVLFEYWHAVDSVATFQVRGIPCILDMHNVLWQSYERQLTAKRGLPSLWRDRAVTQYKTREERAWTQFDGLIAINASEKEYVQSVVPDDLPIFYAPMGTDLELWSYSWAPVNPPRIAYYGSLGSLHNQQDALACYEHVMPEIWSEFPKAELWLVGSNPPASLQSLTADSRVKVTGYLKEIQRVLNTMSLVVCPWSGTYGFRSRLIEVMALGVPVVASPQAVYGMGMAAGQGIFLEKTFSDMAEACLCLLRNSDFAWKQSKMARLQVEETFSFEATYGQLASNLAEFVWGKGN